MSALCAKQDVKTYRGITSAGQDAQIELLITSVSAAIETFCNRTFGQASYTETRNGNDSDRMMTRNTPITAVTSVTVDDTVIPVAPSVTSYGYVFDDKLVYIRMGGFCAGIQNIVIAYTAGYVLIPPDVQEAAIIWILASLDKANRPDQRSKTLANQTESYDLSDIPATVRTRLKRYQRWIIT